MGKGTVKGAEEMSRLIINYDDDIPTSNALHYVKAVVDLSRISGEGGCYCYVTTFNDGTVVFAETTKKGTDTFRIQLKEQNAR